MLMTMSSKSKYCSQRICAWMGKFARQSYWIWGFTFVIFWRKSSSRVFIGHKTFVACVVCFFPFQWQCWQFLLIISSCFTNELKKHSMNFTINWKWYCAQKAGNLSWLALSVLQLMPQKYHRDNEMWKLLVSKLAFINQSIIRSLSLGGAQKFDFNEISFIMGGWLILWVPSINQNKSEMMTAKSFVSTIWIEFCGVKCGDIRMDISL